MSNLGGATEVAVIMTSKPTHPDEQCLPRLPSCIYHEVCMAHTAPRGNKGLKALGEGLSNEDRHSMSGGEAGMLQNWNGTATAFEFLVQRPALRKTRFLLKPNPKDELFLSITKL